MSQERSDNPWADAGIPGQTRIVKLLYSRAAEVLVVVVDKELESGLFGKRLYVRAVTETSYHPIPVQDALEIQESAACCDLTPFVIYNELRFRPPKAGFSEGAADWVGVCKFNLSTGARETILDRQSLRAPRPYISASVSNILAAWPDGLGAVCTLALKRAERKDKLVVEYFVFDVSFEKGLVRQIASLPRVFL